MRLILRTALATAALTLPWAAMALNEPTVPAPAEATPATAAPAEAPAEAPANATVSAPAAATPALSSVALQIDSATSIPAPPAGKGQVVFFRKGGLMGAAISCAVHENGLKVSSLSPGKFVVVAADPGIHSYSVKSEATDTLRLEIESGETYYAKCNITMGVMAGRPNLSPADQTAFAALSAKLKPVVNKP